MDRIEIVEHRGEVRLRLHAATPGGLAAVAGRALAELEVGQESPGGATEWRDLQVSGRDFEAVLVNWLNELIYLAEAERWVAVEFRVVAVTETGLAMRVRGVRVDTAPSAVKAATFHGLRVERAPGGVTADIVLDV